MPYFAETQNLIAMKTEILAYFSENWTGSKDELAEIIDALNIKTIKRGTILVQEGAVSTLCYYILKGCVRQYVLEDGIEKTTAFYTENQAVVPFQTYLKGKPSNHFTVCLEDVTAIVGNPEEEKEMYRKFPNLESLTRTMVEQDFGKTQEEFANFVTSSPEKRYLDLMKNRPDLIQRVPQHQIASYLGVTPESLSRIRRRLAKK
jgi:CRP-like cAMP-binding protein